MSYWTHADRFGILIDNEKVPTEKLLKVAPGNTFYFSMAQKIYENFTITEEGITGDRVSKGQSVIGPMYENIMNQENVYSYPFPSDMSLPDGTDEYRAAGYVVPATGRGTPYIQLLFKIYPNGIGYTGSVPVYKSGNLVEFLGQQMAEAIITTNNLADGSAPSTSLATPISAIQGIANNYWSRLENANYFQVLEVSTNIPIFDTQAHCEAYLDDETGETDEGIVNPVTTDLEEEYKLDQLEYYIHNIWKHVHGGTELTRWVNYKFKPGYNSKIRLYKTRPTANNPYNLVLIVPPGMTRYVGPKGQYNDDSAYEIDSGEYANHYLSQSITISAIAPRDYYTVSDFDTNIPIFADRNAATDYANDIIGIEEALNYRDIMRYMNDIMPPELGEADAETELGFNGQSYAAGSCFYALTYGEMADFFIEVFTDVATFEDFWNGNKMFGENQMDAIFGCMYLPISDISVICGVGSLTAIRIGGWISQQAQGKKINTNTGLIDCGSAFFPDVYKDVRDYEPYTMMYVQLPYCGTYQLSIQKYINKTISVKYAVDIFSGNCMALIFADGILLDCFDGSMGSQRPVTGRTASTLLSALTSGGVAAAGMVGGAVKAGGISAGLGQGAVAAAAGTDVGMAAVTTGGAAGAGFVGAAAVGAGAAIGGAAVGMYASYKIEQAAIDPPMSSRGGYNGNLGYFANQKIHFIFAMKRTIRPENELDLIGYPSGRSGKIGEFSGFLKSTCVYLADGFIGSRQERDEILEMIGKGIYL